LIVSSLRSCVPLAYFDNECAKQLLYTFDDSVWGMKITALEEAVDFATLDTEKLFSELKSHELYRKGRPIMMSLLLVRLLLLVLVLVVMWLTPPTLLTHLLWSLLCPLWLQLLISSTRVSLMIVNSLRSCAPLAYSDNERAKQLLYALDDSV
jgi:hypothetical protein